MLNRIRAWEKAVQTLGSVRPNLRGRMSHEMNLDRGGSFAECGRVLGDRIKAVKAEQGKPLTVLGTTQW